MSQRPLIARLLLLYAFDRGIEGAAGVAARLIAAQRADETRRGSVVEIADNIKALRRVPPLYFGLTEVNRPV